MTIFYRIFDVSGVDSFILYNLCEDYHQVSQQWTLVQHLESPGCQRVIATHNQGETLDKKNLWSVWSRKKKRKIAYVHHLWKKLV
jgi:hypothetical protein